MTKTILVTGGAGFIGGTFIRKTLSTIPGIDIVNLDVLTYASNKAALDEFVGDPRYTFFEGSILDHKLVRRVLNTYQPNYIIHFAAQTHVDRSIDGPRPFVDANVVGTFALLEEIRRWGWPANFKFVHISTDEVYGSAGIGESFTEESRYDPGSPYSASKAAADHFVRAYHRTYKVPTIITNCCNNYGPYQFPEKLIPLMVLNGLEGKELPVYGSGHNVRDWIYVGDHVDALWCVLSAGKTGSTYNVGADCDMTNLALVQKICDVLTQLAEVGRAPDRDYRKLITFVRDRPGHDRAYVVCSRKLRALGWAPSTPFEEGLRQTVEWYCDNRQWIVQIHDRRRLGDAQRNPVGGRRGDQASSDHKSDE